MSISVWSLAAVPALIVIFLTGLFGLNDVQIRDIRSVSKRAVLVEMLLGLSFLATAWTSFTIAAACTFGANIYTWRGCLMAWGIAGIFGLVGRFAPWRYWLRRVSRGAAMEAPLA